MLKDSGNKFIFVDTQYAPVGRGVGSTGFRRYNNIKDKKLFAKPCMEIKII